MTTIKEDSRNLAEMTVGQFKRVATSILSATSPQDAPTFGMIGKPGEGKTEIAQQIAAELGLAFIPVHLGQVHPLDMGVVGLDNSKREAYFAKPPLYDAVMSKQGRRLLFLDEYDRAQGMVQGATMQLLSRERKLNTYHFADTFVMLAANAWHAQYTFELDNAARSRLYLAQVKSQPDEWLEWAASNGIDSRIIICVHQCPDVLQQHGELTDGAMKVADPRAWHMLSDSLKTGLDPELASLAVGTHAAKTFSRYVNFQRDYREEIQKVLAGQKLKLEGVKAAERDLVLFGIYLAAAGQVRKQKGDNPYSQAIKFLQNSCDQIGDEKTYIAGKMITYNIPLKEMSTSQEFQKLHVKVRGSVRGDE